MPAARARSAFCALSLACLAFLALAPRLAAQQRGGEPPFLAGVVVDAGSGAPISGALVALAARNRGVLTDAEGRFTLRDLKPGSQALTVAQLGYDSLRTEVKVEGGPATVVLRLRPNPVVLEGIQVVSDRLRSRRNSIASSVWAFDRRALQTSGARDALDFVRSRTSLTPTPCLDRMSMASCAYVRGRPTPVAVYIDDVPVFGGLEFLDSYRPEELYLVEVFSGGRQVRVYTNWFVEWSAKTGRRPAPVLIR